MNILYHIIDFIFPPNKEELELRNISAENLLELYQSKIEVPFLSIYAIFNYKNPIIKELVWQIKYKKNKHAINLASYALYRKIIKKYPNDKLILIPIPISKKRLRERGYNQTELLVDEIVKLDKLNKIEKNNEILIRKKHINKQTLLDRKSRIENTKNIFEIVGEIDKNKTIIIIDDVTTTGSTLNEAMNIFLAFGYQNVQALAIAH